MQRQNGGLTVCVLKWSAHIYGYLFANLQSSFLPLSSGLAHLFDFAICSHFYLLICCWLHGSNPSWGCVCMGAAPAFPKICSLCCFLNIETDIITQMIAFRQHMRKNLAEMWGKVLPSVVPIRKNMFHPRHNLVLISISSRTTDKSSILWC